MPKRKSTKIGGGPLPKRDFATFKKKDFAPLVEDVRVLKEDVRVLKIDGSVMKGDLKQLRTDFLLAQEHNEKRFQQIISTLDQIVTMFRGLQDSNVLHGHRLTSLEARVDRLEAR